MTTPWTLKTWPQWCTYHSRHSHSFLSLSYARYQFVTTFAMIVWYVCIPKAGLLYCSIVCKAFSVERNQKCPPPPQPSQLLLSFICCCWCVVVVVILVVCCCCFGGLLIVVVVVVVLLLLLFSLLFWFLVCVFIYLFCCKDLCYISAFKNHNVQFV